jgi:hypothetical protein
MEDIRVYVIDITIANDQEAYWQDLDDETFIAEAEVQGGIYTLKRFEEAYNEETISTTNTIIRILNKNSYTK